MTVVTSSQRGTPARNSASQAARARAKEAVRIQLREIARRHIQERGTADLSLRAVARELDMTSSTIYRYVRSREELITSLVVESYEAVAEAAERADRLHAGAGADAAARWLGIARAIRTWALLHPYEYTLIYGSPMGDVPSAAVGPPAARIWRVVAGLMSTAVSTGVLHPHARPFDVQGLVADHVLATLGPPAAPFDDFIVRGMALFSSLIGAISTELSGHFHGLTTDADRLFDLVVATGAQGVGLDLPVEVVDGFQLG
ncbi:TetR/AcrR family transcriptional regulator [Nakamurella sp. PAMC28650]|uniref:TetR/AcrR family transcriptional regulator n=1 Tax=Nakamurella sp. PAMC28650 TaxID=2762325 RepID=UPI00164E0D97|nr:TetR/AcrR family transcriptional regulator [Nakamurella sp. PAMC28650]QNK82765.1 TetR/AcrR family transcriptional regulator [Nakamurella sp. PAMC28650]